MSCFVSLSLGGSSWKFAFKELVALTPLFHLLRSPNKLSRELNKTFTKYIYEKFKKYIQATQANYLNASSPFLQGILLQNCVSSTVWKHCNSPQAVAYDSDRAACSQEKVSMYQVSFSEQTFPWCKQSLMPSGSLFCVYLNVGKIRMSEARVLLFHKCFMAVLVLSLLITRSDCVGYFERKCINY